MEEDHLRRLGENQGFHCYGHDELQNDMRNMIQG